MKLYVSGPIRGVEGHNRETFRYAATALCSCGFSVVNPHDVVACVDMRCGGDPQYVHTWECWMKYELREMMLCDGVALLPGWQESRGASMEVRIAEDLRIPQKMFWCWITDVPGTGFVVDPRYKEAPRRADAEQSIQAVPTGDKPAEHGARPGTSTIREQA